MIKLQDRCKKFIVELGIPITKFCARISLSRTCLYDWFNGKLELSQATLDRIDKFLVKYNF